MPLPASTKPATVYPEYSGTDEEDVTRFLARMERALDDNAVYDEDARIDIAAGRLRYTAADWWQMYRGQFHDWNDFADCLDQQFNSPDKEIEIIRRLVNERQTTERMEAFVLNKILLCQRVLPQLAVSSQITNIIGLARDGLRSRLRDAEPHTLEHLKKLARNIDIQANEQFLKRAHGSQPQPQLPGQTTALPRQQWRRSSPRRPSPRRQRPRSPSPQPRRGSPRRPTHRSPSPQPRRGSPRRPQPRSPSPPPRRPSPQRQRPRSPGPPPGPQRDRSTARQQQRFPPRDQSRHRQTNPRPELPRDSGN